MTDRQDGTDPVEPPLDAGRVPPAAEPPAPGVGATPGGRLTRPRGGRVVGGVAGALAGATGIDRGLVRLGFVLTGFFGGIGLVAYLLTWAALPSEGDAEAPLERGLRRFTQLPPVVRVLLGVGAVLLLVDALDEGAGPGVAIAFVAVGVLLLRQDTLAQATPTGPPAPFLPAPPRGPGPGDPAPPAGTPASSQADRAGWGATAATAVGASPARAPLTTPAYGGWSPSQPPAPRRPPSLLGRLTIGVGLLVLGGAAGLEGAGVLDLGPPQYLALALLVIGVGLVVGAWVGRARWLALLGLLLLPPLAAAQVAGDLDLDLSGGIGERTARVVDVADLDDAYRLGVGALVLDLGDLEVPRGRTVVVAASVGLGELQVVVPPDVTVEGVARVRGGGIELLDGTSVQGPGERAIRSPADEGAGRIELTLETAYGQIAVERSR